jgi:hypothetical protein
VTNARAEIGKNAEPRFRSNLRALIASPARSIFARRPTSSTSRWPASCSSGTRLYRFAKGWGARSGISTDCCRPQTGAGAIPNSVEAPQDQASVATTRSPRGAKLHAPVSEQHHAALDHLSGVVLPEPCKAPRSYAGEYSNIDTQLVDRNNVFRLIRQSCERHGGLSMIAIILGFSGDIEELELG